MHPTVVAEQQLLSAKLATLTTLPIMGAWAGFGPKIFEMPVYGCHRLISGWGQQPAYMSVVSLSLLQAHGRTGLAFCAVANRSSHWCAGLAVSLGVCI